MEKFLTIVILFAPVLTFMLYTEQVNLNTKIGAIVGKTEEVTIDGVQKEIAVFLGIPYAEPPTGHLRFKKPVQKGKLPSPYNATIFRAGAYR